MANTPWEQTKRGTRYRTLDTDAVIQLGDASGVTVSQWAVKVKVNTPGGTFTPKARVVGSELSGSDLDDMVYYSIDSETAITTSSSAANIYYIPSDGVDVFLDFVAGGGSITIYVWPFQG
ncbi:MAG: hypothetical protein ACYC3L_01380 [Gemmatimonadaceae bacterium]